MEVRPGWFGRQKVRITVDTAADRSDSFEVWVNDPQALQAAVVAVGGTI